MDLEAIKARAERSYAGIICACCSPSSRPICACACHICHEDIPNLVAAVQTLKAEIGRLDAELARLRGACVPTEVG